MQAHYVATETWKKVKEECPPVFFIFLFWRYWNGATLTCACYYLGQLEQSSGPEPGAATEAVSPIDKLYKIVNSLAEKMRSFSKTSDKADSATEEMADILTSWNRDFVKLKPHEHALLSNRIASTPGVLNSFLSLADNLLPGKHCAACITRFVHSFSTRSSKGLIDFQLLNCTSSNPTYVS